MYYINIEPPEEPAEKRSLFEQLQEQKDTKDKEWEEEHSLSLFFILLFNLHYFRFYVNN